MTLLRILKPLSMFANIFPSCIDAALLKAYDRLNCLSSLRRPATLDTVSTWLVGRSGCPSRSQLPRCSNSMNATVTKYTAVTFVSNVFANPSGDPDVQSLS